MTTSLSKDLIFLILQFLDEEKYKETIRMLEQESGLFFSMKHFEELILGGKWEEAEKYLSAFTRIDDNRFSMKIFFEIRKQKYLEALDKHERVKALDILNNDLKVFSSYNEHLFNEMTQLLTLDNLRENPQLSTYRDAKTARSIMLEELKKLIEANPLFRDKLQFPTIKNSRLRMLINQSLNWQHSLCANPRLNPDIRTLLVDHSCRNSSDPYPQIASSNPLTVPVKTESFTPMCTNGPFQATSTPLQTPLNAWASASSSMSQPVVSGGVVGLGGPTMSAAVPKGLGDSDSLLRARFPAIPDRIILQGMSSSQSNGLQFNMKEELPKNVARILNLGSAATSMDFHPLQQTLLLVGTNNGEICLWEVRSGEKLVSRNFQLWDMGASSIALKAALVKDPSVSVRRVLWSTDSSLFGVAYSKHIVQLYTYFGGNDIRQHLEIDSHIGAVNDLAFCSPSNQLIMLTCGDDKNIKVWDVAAGTNLFTFEGHEAAIHSVCPHYRENVNFVLSTSVDGMIKAWLYDGRGSRVNYYAPNHSCATMAYSKDGKRLFSCGTTKDGESHMVEWNENDGTVKRSYQGLNKRSLGVVQFDTAKNRFLAAGHDYSVKFWDMDNSMLLTTVDAEGGLPASPRIRFNKEGWLLAVSANDNKIKILATVEGLRLMGIFETQPHTTSRPTSDAPSKNGDSKRLDDSRPRSAEVPPAKVNKLTEFSSTGQFRSQKISADLKTDKISRLVYTNSGNAILALAFNAIHLLWKWPRGDLNLNGQATTKVSPQLVQQSSGIVMTNDRPIGRPNEIMPCFALSKNDSYVLSASGGKISLFNMLTFKTMATFMPPPPAATCLAFHPGDNNIVAIGMDDSTIHIYNVRTDEVKNLLKGHSKRITGLAFSHPLNILVSSGADSQIIVWNLDNWERQNGCFLQTSYGRTSTARSDAQVQFHQDQKHLLVVNSTQLSIYEARKLECIKQWIKGEALAPISDATFSCNGQLVYSSFLDGMVRVFVASDLQLLCQINPTAYIPSDISSSVYPVVVAAHPQEPNQFAVGLTDGSIYVFEPPESEGKWEVPQRLENGPSTSTSPAVAALDQPRG